MTNQASDIDRLIRRLQDRAADPERRTDYRPSVFDDRVQKLDLSGLFAEVLRAGNDLGRLVAANRQGNVPPDLASRVEMIADEKATPASSSLPSPVSAVSLAVAEAQLGIPLPHLLRRIYTEVADGGFGPSAGLLPVARVLELYLKLLGGSSLPRGREWPKQLLPLVEESMATVCVDTSTVEGRVIAWDPEDLTENASAPAWLRSFKDEAPSLQGWLEQWLDRATHEEQFQATSALTMAAQVEMARESRAKIAAMSPAERAAMGLPEVGWEAIIWGGLGWDGSQGSGTT